MASDILPGTTAGKDPAKPRHAAPTRRVGRPVELSADGHCHLVASWAEVHHDATTTPDADTSLERPADTPLSQRSTHRAPRIGFAAFESTALFLLLIDGLLCWLAPLLAWTGWGVGLAFLCLSRRWNAGDKVLGASCVGLAPVTLSGCLLLAVDNQLGPVPPALAGYLMIVLLALILFAFVRLCRRAWQS
jgi:hypothetical protein